MELDQNIKLLVFDFDGTLFDLEVDWDRLRQKLGISGTGQSLGALIQEYRLQKHPDLTHVTEAELEAVKAQRLSDEVIEVLRRLHLKYNISILTRNSRRVVEEVLKQTGLEGKIYIVGREDVEKLKPHPEGLAQILGHFKIRAQRAALVGDTYHDVEVAKNAGAVSIIVRNKKLTYSPDGADWYIESLSELK